MKGGPFKKGVRIDGALLMDMAPTLLYLMGQRIPESMDGRMLVDAFDSAFVQQHPVQYEKTSAVSLGERESSSYTADEAALVQERLKALGYID